MAKLVFSRLLMLFAATVFAVAANAAADGSGDPQAVIRGTVEDLRTAVLRDKAIIDSDPNHAVELVDQIVSPHVDTVRSGRLILGKHWREATPEQQQQFIDNFKRLLLRTYAINVSDYTDVSIAYLQTTHGDDPALAVVRTRISVPGKQQLNIDYRMIKTDGGWKVYDVLADGVSIVVTFRTGVDTEIQQYGMDGFITRLSERSSKPLTTSNTN
ncbi:MAG TPA: ABC transporter substrate-binding protein [Gammaproteobacteria bacterium]|nr:ABC transporter substrate-binding protein [Gammaproteobacteria bacterium]